MCCELQILTIPQKESLKILVLFGFVSPSFTLSEQIVPQLVDVVLFNNIEYLKQWEFNSHARHSQGYVRKVRNVPRSL